MAVDGRSRPADVPGEGGAAGQADVDGAPGAAETRSRAEYYAALRAADPDRPRPGGDEPARGSAWEAPGLADHPARPEPESLHLGPDRRAHILDGDAGGGGHRHGAGRPGKTEFPADWSDDKVTASVLSVAQAPELARYQPNGRWLVTGTRDEVRLSAVVLPDGQIWTAYPLPGSPGVTQNPRNR
jgi:hypothetical protein